MPGRAFPERQKGEFVSVDLRGFAAGRPPLVDINHKLGGLFVAYCEARAIFSETARLWLSATGVPTLYLHVTNRGIDAGGADDATLLSLPDSELAPSVKSAILYKSTLDTTQTLFDAPNRPENYRAAETMVGTVALHLSANPDAFSSVVEMMNSSFDLYNHSVNVCTYSVALGDQTGLSKTDVLTLGMAALVHDVGMTRVPARIVNKPSLLTEQEMAVIRQHPDWGAELVGSVDSQRARVAEVVRRHHERIDGQGYPRGLRGSQIDTLTRALTVANVYDSLTSVRPQRPAMQPYQALDTMRRMGGQMDPDLFAEFVRLFGRGAR